MSTFILIEHQVRRNQFVTKQNPLGIGDISHEVEVNFIDNGAGSITANIGYGFNSKRYQVSTKEPGMPRETYMAHSSIFPSTSQTFVHKQSGRVFKFGEREGFLHHTCPLIEVATGKEVATIIFESYYKD